MKLTIRYLLVLLLFMVLGYKAQSQSASFSIAAPGTSYSATHQCSPFQATLVNTSTCTYDQAIWTLQINASGNCNGPWGTWSTQTFNAPTQANPATFTVNAPGVYTVKLELYLAGALVCQTTQSCIFQIFPKPTASFTAAPSPICGGGQVIYTPVVSGGTAPFSYNWNFGGGNPATSLVLNPPPVNYSCRSQPYSTTFVATDANGCYDLWVDPSAVLAPCKPNASFSITSGSPCNAPATLGFSASPSPPGYSYQWWFTPAGTPASGVANHTGANISHTFPSISCYDLQLVVIDNTSGCKDTLKQSNAVCVQGFSVSSFTANQSTICNGQTVCCTLHIVNSSGLPLNSCFFTGTATPNSGSGTSASASFNSIGNGDYVGCFTLAATTNTVTYTISIGSITNTQNACNITYNGTTTVTVKPSPVAQVNLTAPYLSSYCAPAHNFCFNASMPGANAGATVEWYLNSAYSGPPAGTNPSSFCQFFTGVGTHFVYLKVCLPAAAGGCCAYGLDSVILQKPTFTFVADTISGCGPITTNFTATSHNSSDSIYLWYPTGFPSSVGPFVTTTQFFTYTYPAGPDSCYSPVCISIQKAVGTPPFACTDTFKRLKFIKVGHKVTPHVVLSPNRPCLKKGVACVSLVDSIPGYHFPVKAGTCPAQICDWYFTKPGSITPIFHSFNCDTPKICFADTGKFDAYYRFCIGGCCDTVKVDTPIIVSGIIAAFTDSVHCTSAGQLTIGPPTVTFHTTYKIYPQPTSGKVYTQMIFNTVANPSTGAPPYIIYDSLNYGTPANPLNPQFHTYNVSAFPQAGCYPVSFVVSYPQSGCPNDTSTRNVCINSITAVPRLVPSTSNFVICRHTSLTFSSGRSNPSHPDIVEWNFCENSTHYPPNPSNDTLITHTFDSCGFFCAKLYISNASGSCKDSAEITGIRVVDFTPNFVLTGGTGCNPCLTLTNNTTYCFTSFDSIYINWNTQSIPPFSDVQHINTNFASITHCVTNVQPGGSQVYYELFESQGHCMKSGYMNYNTDGVLADFSLSTDTLICAGVPVTMTSTTAGNPLLSDYVWNIGSGTCATAPVPYNNPSLPNVGVTTVNQTFNSQGYFYVTMYAGNNYCRDSICKTIHVQNPVACFTMKNDTLTCPGLDTITNCSYGAADSLILTFNTPNAGGTGLPLFYTASYPKPFPTKLLLPAKLPGVYQVCVSLINFGAGCTDSMCQTLVVTGPIGHMVSQQNVSVCAGTPVQFCWYTNSWASPNVIPCDSLPFSLPYNPSYNYCATHYFSGIGQCITQIWMQDSAGCSYPLYDTVLVDRPQSGFTWSINGVPGANGAYCGPVTVSFSDTSHRTIYALDPLSYHWTFYHGNGSVISTSTQVNPAITFFPPDTISAKLEISSTYGCKDTVLTTNIVQLHQVPIASFTNYPDTLCITQCLTYTNTSINPEPNAGYTWYYDWTNHTPNATTTNGSFCYNTAGIYKTVLIDSSIYGCVDTSAVKVIDVLANIQALFTIANDTLCGNSGTAFFNSTSIPNSGISYCWNFGDVPGDSTTCHSTGASPTHVYNLVPAGSSGNIFRVRLRIQSPFGCMDSTTHNVSIFPNPIAGIAALPTTSCDPLNTNFTDASTSINPIANYTLNYGLPGSTNYNSLNPIGGASGQFQYTPAGNYTATYTITTGEGCTSSTTISFIVNPNPIACAGADDTICNGDLISIGCQPVPGLQYGWYRPVSATYFTPSNTVAQPVVHPSLPMDFCLNVVNQFGCQDTDCVNIYVWPLVTMTAGRDSNICYGQPITLWSNAIGPTIGNYHWHNLNGTYSSTQQNITVSPLHNETYTVAIQGPCNSDSTDVYVNVYQPPPVTLEPSATIVAGQPYSILAVGVGTAQWFPNYAINCPTCLNPIVSPEVNTTYHVVLTDAHGCVDSAEISITVLCDRTNAVYVPNAFTPSKPGKNDHFYVQGTGVKEINYLRIYNRWGNLVFSTEHIAINKPELGWDGNFGGKEMSSDVFMYQMQVECSNGTIFPISGNFTLIR